MPLRRRRSPAPASAARLMTAAWRLAAALLPQPSPLGAITEVAAFGSNPGNLRMMLYTPPVPPRRGAPLVVVLHGCGQDAAGFATQAGWVAVAARLGIPLVLPKQTLSNNHALCFNWHQPGDARRGGGEALSIRQMVRTAALRFGSDRRQVFVVGFSAGGAMAATLLAAYPAVFAAGAVIAGLPVGTASNAPLAAFRMARPNQLRSREAWADAVRASTLPRPTRSWPRLLVWTGERDRTVAPRNAWTLAAQWTELHGWDPEPAVDELAAPGVRRRAWGLPGRPAVELWTVAGLGHTVPVNAAALGGGGHGPWVRDGALCATSRIVQFWGLA